MSNMQLPDLICFIAASSDWQIFFYGCITDSDILVSVTIVDVPQIAATNPVRLTNKLTDCQSNRVGNNVKRDTGKGL